MAKIKAKLNFDEYIVEGDVYEVVFFKASGGGVVVLDAQNKHFILDEHEYEAVENEKYL